MRSIGFPELIVILIFLGAFILPVVAGVVLYRAVRSRGNSTASRFCSHCGQRIPDLGKFCCICGQPLQ